ncbi:MAG: hypothetical protein U9R54_07840 [Bacteroidota bacterium]|nr:hypothetical protein [Bacteroidota bacterium]
MTENYEPHRIDIVLDNECNLSCIGCIRTKNKKESGIDYSKFINGIAEKCNKENYQKHFTGGLPFLYWDLLT